MRPDEINVGDIVISRTWEDMAEEWNQKNPDSPIEYGDIPTGTTYITSMAVYGGQPLHIAHKRESKAYGWVFRVAENRYSYTAEMFAEAYSDIDPEYEAADITSLF